MMHHMTCTAPSDRLCKAIDSVCAPLCVGLDPVIEKLPEELQILPEKEAFETFCLGVLDAIEGIAAAVKFQSACFERIGSQGVQLLGELRQHAHSKGLQVILDAKRGDIGISAEHYAHAATADGPCDWVTVNPYLGVDAIEPFLEAGLGVFCLVRTSNLSGDTIQTKSLEDGRSVADLVADLLTELGSNYLGSNGWSDLGAVVGATKPIEAQELRDRMPKQIFLMPGIGAQGATVNDVASCFGNGYGALATASRSLIYPRPNQDWQTDIANASKKLQEDLKMNQSK